MRSSVIRAAMGLAGALAWPAMASALPGLPPALAFLAAWLLFTFGCGIAGVWLFRDLDPLRRLILVLGIGSGATPVVVELLGRAGWLAAFPYVVSAMAGVGLACWRSSRVEPFSRTTRDDLAATALITVLALSLGAIVFANRLAETPERTMVFGDYDSFDLSFYASWAAEATHTVPPSAGYYSGHELHGAYYPQLVLSMVNRFARVPMLSIYFGYSWPVFLAIGALTAYVLVRSLAGPGASLLTVVLLLIGGDFSYLPAWLLPHTNAEWDYVLWPTNFLAPTMEVLHFNTWTPTLPVFFTALFAITRGVHTGSRVLIAAGGLLLAVLFQFKPFAYAVILAGLGGALVFSGRDAAARWRFAAVMGLGLVFVVPLLAGVADPEHRRSELVIDFFLLPERMLLKLGIGDAMSGFVDRWAPVSLHTPVRLTMATTLFLAGGLAIRWIGLPGVWRAIRNRGDRAGSSWRLLAWTTAAGILIPFVLVTDPYQDTLQFYQTGLYVLWIFTGVALASFASARGTRGVIVAAVLVLISIPSSVHYLARKWTDDARPARAVLDRGGDDIARYLQHTDARQTVVLHDQPMEPSLLNIVSARRVVLAWGHPNYAPGSGDRAYDVERFFHPDGDDPAPALETLRRYAVTHVVIRDGSRVHPDVIATLEPVLQVPGATLYRRR
jgi:hypothetical protein